MSRAEAMLGPGRMRRGITDVLQRAPVGVLTTYAETVAPDGQGALTDYAGPMLRSG